MNCVFCDNDNLHVMFAGNGKLYFCSICQRHLRESESMDPEVLTTKKIDGSSVKVRNNKIVKSIGKE